MWKLLVTHRKRPNLIMTLSNVCIMVSVLLDIKSLKIVVYISLGSQDVKRPHQHLRFELGAQFGVCVCVCVCVCMCVCLRGQTGVGEGQGRDGAPCEMKLITSKGRLAESRWAAL